jgi:transposase
MSHVEQIEARSGRFDARPLDGLANERSALARLPTVPGISLPGAAVLPVDIGTDMAIFASADRLASWEGICPGNHGSAGKRQSGRVRHGNPSSAGCSYNRLPSSWSL